MTTPALASPPRSAQRVARPPGPGGAAYLRAVTSGRPRGPVDLFTRTARAHPRLAHTRLLGEHIYVLNHPDLVRQVLVAHGRATVKSRGLQAAKHLLGEGLLTSEGEAHRRQRRLLQPAFHTIRIARYTEQMTAAAAEHTARWRAAAGGGELTVDMSREMSALTLAIVGRTLFGTDLRGEAGQVAAALEASLRSFRRMLLPFGPQLLRLPLPGSRRALAAAEQLDSLVREIVTARRQSGRRDTGDVLSMLLLAAEDGVGMSDRQVRDEVMTLLLAGHETTANALAWCCHLLATHPEAAEPVYAEVSGRLGGPRPEPAGPDPTRPDPGGRDGGRRLPRYDDLAGMPATTAAIAEAMRLYPPAWIMGRRLTAPAQLDSWTLPAGSICLASQWVLHRDPRFWSDPLTYRPDRWLTAEGAFELSAPGQPRATYFPFGLGSRVCIGESFAWAEAVLVLATVLRDWRPEPVPDWPVDVRPVITLRPAHGLGLRLRARA